MKRITLIASAFLIAGNAFAVDNKPHNLAQIAKDYMAAKNAVQQKHSTKKDIETMVGFMRDDIQTEHRPYKLLSCENDGKGKDGFREGLSYYLGKYESTDTEILEVIEGQNMVAIKFIETVKGYRDGKLISDKSKQLFILEFKDGLISKELRYDL